METLAKNFKITCSLQKAYSVIEEDGSAKRLIAGLASGIDIDLEKERMSKSVVMAFQKAINEGIYLDTGEFSQVPLRSGHQREWEYIIGYLVKAELDENYNLWITAELEDGNPKADLLYRRLTRDADPRRPVQLGLSVGGIVVSAGHEYDDYLQRMVKTYYDVALEEVSVVSRPAYPTQYLRALQKSVSWSAVEEKTQLVSDDELRLLKTLSVTKEKPMEDENVAEVTADVEKTEAVAEVTEEVAKEEAAEVVEEVVKEETIEATEEVEKAVEVEADATEDVIKSLQAEMSELRGQVTDMIESLSKYMSKPAAPAAAAAVEDSPVVEEVAAEVEKSEEVVEEPVVAKHESAPAEGTADLATLLKSIIAEAMDSKLAPINTKLKELEETPVDKSIAINDPKDHMLKSHGDLSDDALQEFVQGLANIPSKDAMGAAMRAAFGGK